MSKKICILGGTGFVGQHIVNMLVNRGYQLTVLTRRIERHRYLKVFPSVQLRECNVYDPRALKAALADHDAVINLVGILNPSRNNSFRKVHLELPTMLGECCKALGIPRLLHMSALRADKRGGSQYLQSKGRGEDALHALADENLAVTSFRPSVIFGEGDSFMNRFAGLIRLSPGFLPLACPDSRFAPVYVGDVAQAFADALESPESFGKRVDLCGPKAYTLRELVAYAAKLTGCKTRIIDLPDWVARIQASILELLPGKLFTLDNFNSLQTDSLCTKATKLCPTALEAIAPLYLGALGKESLLQGYRNKAGRSMFG